MDLIAGHSQESVVISPDSGPVQCTVINFKLLVLLKADTFSGRPTGIDCATRQGI